MNSIVKLIENEQITYKSYDYILFILLFALQYWFI